LSQRPEDCEENPNHMILSQRGEYDKENNAMNANAKGQ
jgi:hypothetical protein